MMRRRFLADLKTMEHGGDPKGIVRDPAKGACIELPTVDHRQMVEGITLDAILRDPNQRERLREFIFQSGQPDVIRRAFVDAMGIEGIDLGQAQQPVDLLSSRQ